MRYGGNRGRGIAVGFGFLRVEGGRGDDGDFGAVAVAFEDFFGGDVCAVAEEVAVVEDEGEVFWYLCIMS